MMPPEIEPLKLTKKFLMSLPEGCYLVSNCTDDMGCPIYEGVVARHEVRDMQWEKLKQVGADQRHCHVFNSKIDAVRFVEGVENLPLNRPCSESGSEE